jgi:hypothetical protein
MDWPRFIAFVVAIVCAAPVMILLMVIGVALAMAAGDGIVRFVMAMFGYR